MSDETQGDAKTWASEKDRIRDLKRRKRAQIKFEIGMWFHKWTRRFLWATHLARPYSEFMCNRGWYGKHPDGRCQWCGVKHSS